MSVAKTHGSKTIKQLKAGGTWLALGVVIGGLAGMLWLGPRSEPPPRPATESRPAPTADVVGSTRELLQTVKLSTDEQGSIGLQMARAVTGQNVRSLRAPGRIQADETRYAIITPRASGIVRTVQGRVGQDVKAGQLLATIESAEVGQARLDLMTRRQMLDVARTQADWQKTIYDNTLQLISALEAGTSPAEIHEQFKDRPLGANRERLVSAYSTDKLERLTVERNRRLSRDNAISTSVLQESEAQFESAQATYQALMDQMEVESRLAHIKAQQSLREAETATRVAGERLRILGVDLESVATAPGIEGTERLLRQTADKGTTPLPAQPSSVASLSQAMPAPGSTPVSVYEIRAVIDGTIIDQEPIVPGIPVDGTARLFTLTNLETVWIEADVHETDFPHLRGRNGAEVRVRSPAYGDQVFHGKVFYTGDVVNEKSRTIRLMASAPNPDRLLKPGMYVEVEVSDLRTNEGAGVTIPASALVTHESKTYVFVQTGEDSFERREVQAEPPQNGLVSVLNGVAPGEMVVSHGAFTLKAELLRVGSEASGG